MDWIVGITTVISVELMIRRKWYAWLVSLANQFVWLTYIIVAKQWGLLPLNLVMFVQNTRGLISWLRNKEELDGKADHLSDASPPP